MNNTNKRLLAFVVAGVLLATMLIGGLIAIFSTLNSSSTDNPISGLTITTPKDNALEVGTRHQLEAKGTSVTGQIRAVDDKIDWLSLDTAIATIDDQGVIEAKAVGQVDVQATLGSYTDRVTLYTYSREGENILGYISGNLAIGIGGTTQLSATFPNVNNPETFWVSHNESVATISEDGLVTAISGGTARITARLSDTNIVGVATITVAGEGQVVDIVMPRNVDLPLGATHTVQYELLPAGITANVMFESSNTAVITVDNGVLKAVTAGTALVTARVGNVWSATQFEVSDVPVTSLVVNGSETTTVGETVTLNVTVSPINALQVADWTFTPVDPSNTNPIVKIVGETSNVGVVSIEAVGEGQVAFVARRTNTNNANIDSEEFVLTVGARKQVTSVVINRDGNFDGDVLTIASGADITISASTLPASANDIIRWHSSDQNVAKLNTQEDTPSITITPIGAGTATITARAYDKDGAEFEDSITLIVASDNVINLTSVYINGKVNADPIRVVLGDTVQLNGTTDPTNIPTAIRYHSNNEPTATVDNAGLVTTTALGSATIQARIEGNDVVEYASILITVIETPDATNIKINGADVVPSGTRSDYTVTAEPIGVVQNIIWSRDADTNNTEATTGVKVEFITIDEAGEETITQDKFEGEKVTVRLSRVRSSLGVAIGTGTVVLLATHTNTDGTTVEITHTVIVSPNPVATKIEITGQDAAIGGGDITTLTATASVTDDEQLSEGVLQHFVWRSLNEEIAQIGTGAGSNFDPVAGQTAYNPDSSHEHLKTIKVKGLSTGVATIEAEVPNTTLRAAFEVAVTAANANVLSVTILHKDADYTTITDEADLIAAAKADLYDGGTIELKATGWDNVDFADPTANVVNNVSFYWWSSETHIATVDQNGVVTQVPGMSGQVNIYAQAIDTTVYNKVAFVLNVDASRNQRVVDLVNTYGETGTTPLIDASGQLIDLGTTTAVDQQNAINYIQARIDILLIQAHGIVSTDTEYQTLVGLLTPVNAPSSVNGVVAELLRLDNTTGIVVINLVASAIYEPTQDNLDAANVALENAIRQIGVNNFGGGVIQHFINLINA